MIRISVQPRFIGNRREAVWAAIRARGLFTIAELIHDTGLSDDSVRDYVNGFARAGYLERLPAASCGKGHIAHACWRLAQDVGIEAPRVTRDGAEVTTHRAREQLWRTMKMLTEFDKRELAIHASTAAHPVAERGVEHYLCHLHRAGFLHCVRPPKRGVPARYRLLPSRKSGSRAPIVRAAGGVYDPNTGMSYPAGGAA